MSRIAAWMKDGESISIGLAESGKLKEAALFDLFRSVQLSKLVGQRMGTPITREGFDDFDELLRKMQPYLAETQVVIDDEGRYVVTGNNPMAASMLRCHDESGGLRAAIASYEGILKPTFC